MKLAVFDFDSTLMDGETLDFLAKEYNLQDKVSIITQKAMEGKIDFFESLIERVALFKGMKEQKVKYICENLPYMNGAKETISELKKIGYTVICFSGGYKTATIPAQKVLGYDAEFSNILHFKNGELSGKVGGEMMFSDSKGLMLLKLQKILNCSPDDTVVVGDGANDLSMFKYATTKVAFCAKPILKQAATHCIEKKDLTELLTII